MGTLTVGSTPKGICMIEFENEDRITSHQQEFAKEYTLNNKESTEHIDLLKNQLNEYFNKTRKSFDLSLDIIGTPFQISVWNELNNIPFGTTRTYKEQAIAVGDLKAIRAVANANGRNKISIVIPCHRVVGSDGSLTGFGGGLWRKQFLLELESEQISLF